MSTRSISGALIVVRAGAERIGDEAVAIMASGEARRLRDGDENGAGEFVLVQRAETRQTVVLLGTEDLGDPKKLVILPPDSNQGQPWLQAFPQIDELTLSRNGRWAAFVDVSAVRDTGGSRR